MRDNFTSEDYHSFRFLVAFAKVKPFYKLHENICNWNAKGNSVEAIIGVDHKGTSYQALQYILSSFNRAHILHANYSTFHPKLYIFYGDRKATAYYGSSNFTSGGLETNFEGGIILSFDLPTDQPFFNELYKNYSSLLDPSISCTSLLTANLLQKLKDGNLLLDEASPHQSRQIATAGSSGIKSKIFDLFLVQPVEAIPKNIMVSAAASAGIVLNTTSSNTTNQAPTNARNIDTSLSEPIPLVVDGFVIQVSPHHNGEIFLSKLAVEQNNSFFGYPFTGRTVPKNASNSSYPQREPDPVVNIRVFDPNGALARNEVNYNLNTVYYSKKSEIRITINKSILHDLDYINGSTDYPILVMRNSSTPGCDYDMDFYAKGSIIYDKYLKICNQTLPSGGKPISRKMGWF